MDWGRCGFAMGVMLAFACGAPTAGDTDAAPDAVGPPIIDARPDADPYCHYDCFGFHACEDGIVTSWDHTPIPCEDWEGECPHWESYTCERGCRTDVPETGPFEQPSSMCEENRPKQVGDSCTAPEHCDPQVADIDYSGDVPVVTNVYLECDLDLGECIGRDPPIVDDYLQPCGFEAPFEGDGLSYGVRETEVCSGGLCLIVERETCVRQGCTISCDSDDDCPMGAVCRNGVYCKPGPPHDWSEDVLPLPGCD